MCRVLVPLFAMCLLLAISTSQAPAHDPEQIPDLVERVIGGVVHISAVSPKQESDESEKSPAPPELPEGSPFKEFFEEYFERQQEKAGNADPNATQSMGSGFIIDESGIIVTADSIVAGATQINIILASGTELPATIIGRDEKTDVAMLKVSTQEPLKALAFGESSKVRVGQTIVVIGSPFGLGGSVTSGIVSALNRDIDAGPYDRFIQIDAAINRGNAGGPLFNLNGEVIGINTAIISPSGGSTGVAFAVPSDLAKGVIAQLTNYGETRRGWLGVRIQIVTEAIASSLGMNKATGALVASVTPGSPAENGGIEAGDVLLTFDDRDIVTMRSLPSMVAATEIGKPVYVRVLRDEEERTLEITIARLPETSDAQSSSVTTENPPTTAALLGLTVEPLADQARAKYGISKEVKGVIITGVEPGGPAAGKSIKVGDVIGEIGGDEVRTSDEVAAKAIAIRQGGRKSALLLVSDKNGEFRYIALPISETSVPPTAGGTGIFDDLKDDLGKLD